MMHWFNRLVVVCAIANLCPSAFAQIYKCKDANNKPIFTDKPCAFNEGATSTADTSAAKTTPTDSTPLPEPDESTAQGETNYLPHSIKLKMRGLVQQERYRDLNVQLALYQAGAIAVPEDEDELFMAYAAFEEQPPEYRKFLDRWVIATPEAYQPYLARASHSYSLAWAARGGKWSSETSSSQFDAMDSHFSKAREDLDAALARGAPPLVPSYLKLGMWRTTGPGDDSSPLVMKRAQNKDVTAFSELVDSALATSPASYFIRAQAMRALYPRWGGSYEAMALLSQQFQQNVNLNPRIRWLEGFIQADLAFSTMNDAQYTKADELYSAALTHGDNPVVLLNRAKNSYKQEKYQDAIRYLDQSISASAEDSDAYNWRSKAYRMLKDLDNALADSNRASLLDPADEEIQAQRANLAADFHNRAVQYISAGDYNNALKLLGTTIALNPTSQNAYYDRALVFYKSGEYDLALADVKHSIELDPADFSSYRLLDWILIESKDWDQIIRYWNAYIAINPSNPDAYFERFGTYHHKGDPQASMRDLKKASDLGHVKARKMYSEYLSRSAN